MATAAGRAELLIRQRLSALTRALPGARTGDVASVHQARVATRRIREALPLVTSASSARKQGRIVRRLTRALGPVRELDVALLTLDQVSGGAKDRPRRAGQTGVRCLRQAINDERARMHTTLVDAVDRCNIDKLSRKLIAGARKRDAGRSASPRQSRPKHLAAARARAARRAAGLEAAIASAAAIYLPDRLHDVRIAVKKLRYAMEVVKELSGSRASARIATLKRAQDLLGRIHDLEVLIARIRAVQGSRQAPPLQASAELDALVRRLEMECRQLHGRYITMRQSLTAICEHVMTDPMRPERAARLRSGQAA